MQLPMPITEYQGAQCVFADFYWFAPSPDGTTFPNNAGRVSPFNPDCFTSNVRTKNPVHYKSLHQPGFGQPSLAGFVFGAVGATVPTGNVLLQNLTQYPNPGSLLTYNLWQQGWYIPPQTTASGIACGVTTTVNDPRNNNPTVCYNYLVGTPGCNIINAAFSETIASPPPDSIFNITTTATIGNLAQNNPGTYITTENGSYGCGNVSQNFTSLNNYVDVGGPGGDYTQTGQNPILLYALQFTSNNALTFSSLTTTQVTALFKSAFPLYTPQPLHPTLRR